MQMQSMFSWLYKLCTSTTTYSGGSGTDREKSQGEVRREFSYTVHKKRDGKDTENRKKNTQHQQRAGVERF